jgi:type II secretory pathway pseudopilin PulG
MKFRAQHFHPRSAFTMVEIAISLAIIGIALVGIIGVLPLGLHTQRDNREDTVINQDATVFMDAISKGERGLDDLTNYVYAITNSWTEFNASGSVASGGTNGYNYSGFSIASGFPSVTAAPINHGSNIVGLLSVPEYIDPTGKFLPGPAIGNNWFSNHIVAYVRSISGPAVEKPPQDNPILQQDSFSYRIFCVNTPLALPPPPLPPPTNSFNQQLGSNLHELRLTFEWPQLPNGNIGTGRQTYRATIGGQLAPVFTNGADLYFYQPQSFMAAPPPP